MDLHIKQATIISPGSPLHGKQQSLLIQEGRIQAIGDRVEAGSEVPVINQPGLQVSPGWLDFGAQVCDPGYEQRESLHTAGAAAAAGGFTAVVTLPNTLPIIDAKSEVLYICKNAQGKLVNFYPMGAVTMGCKGEAITEMIDMQRAGAVAFTEGSRALQHTGVMLRALQYVKSFGGLVANQPLDEYLGRGGQVHEGASAAALGLPGIPALAEELMVQRDLQLLEYADSRLHLANLSTAAAVDLVRQAKAKGLRVTASVAVMNLVYEEQAIETFDSHFKVMPPLRSAADREALRQGVLDGTIDVIASNHCPLEEEAKKLEFPYAAFGATGLETFYALCRTYLSDWLSDELLVEKAALAPRRILGLPVPLIEPGQMAELTLFHPDMPWVYERSRVYSRSFNSPVLGSKLRGRAIAVVNNNQSFVNGHS